MLIGKWPCSPNTTSSVKNALIDLVYDRVACCQPQVVDAVALWVWLVALLGRASWLALDLCVWPFVWCQVSCSACAGSSLSAGLCLPVHLDCWHRLLAAPRCGWRTWSRRLRWWLEPTLHLSSGAACSAVGLWQSWRRSTLCKVVAYQSQSSLRSDKVKKFVRGLGKKIEWPRFFFLSKLISSNFFLNYIGFL